MDLAPDQLIPAIPVIAALGIACVLHCAWVASPHRAHAAPARFARSGIVLVCLLVAGWAAHAAWPATAHLLTR